MLMDIWLKSSGHQVTLLTHGTNVHLHFSAAEFLPPAFHSKGDIAVTGSHRPLQMSGGWGQGRCCPRIHLLISRERRVWGQAQPTIFTPWLRQGHRVHTPWKGTAIRLQPDTWTRTHSFQWAATGQCRGDNCYRRRAIEGAITQHRHPELY